MTHRLRALTLSLLLWSLGGPLLAQDPRILRLEGDPSESVYEIITQVRHTTVITLPAGESILDFVVGDPEYWALTGSANVAFLKPSAEGVSTNIALVCESGRIYSFLVSEDGLATPHLVVRFGGVAAGGGFGGLGELAAASGDYQPAFVARSRVQGFQTMAEQAQAEAVAVRAQADIDVAAAVAKAEGDVEAFRSSFPARIHFPYRLPESAAAWPFLVEAMWSDGQFTYLRSRAQETPAIYEQIGGEPSLVAYDLTEDGLFIVRRVIGEGLIRIGEDEVRWSYRPLDFLTDPEGAAGIGYSTPSSGAPSRIRRGFGARP